VVIAEAAPPSQLLQGEAAPRPCAGPGWPPSAVRARTEPLRRTRSKTRIWPRHLRTAAGLRAWLFGEHGRLDGVALPRPARVDPAPARARGGCCPTEFLGIRLGPLCVAKSKASRVHATPCLVRRARGRRTDGAVQYSSSAWSRSSWPWQ